MAKPVDRESFKEFCLRRLGKGVIGTIELSDDQCDDIIDYSLNYFKDYHFDGSDIIYYKHQVTQENIDNKYIDMPENVMGVVRVFPISGLMTANDGLFNIQYQLALNDLYTLVGLNLVPYYMMRTHLELIQDVLIGEIPIRYSRHKNKLALDYDWSKIGVGSYLLVEAHEVIDPDVYTDIWNDRWLQDYATAHMKKQWGTNLKKYGQMALVGNVTFNGQIIYDEADNDIKMLEDRMLEDYSLPPQFFVG
jgi:hypothetical protein